MAYFGRKVYFDKFGIGKHFSVLVVYGKDTQKILNRIRRRMFSFMWSGNKETDKFPFGKLGQNCKT
jgi:hypothetical protein